MKTSALFLLMSVATEHISAREYSSSKTEPEIVDDGTCVKRTKCYKFEYVAGETGKPYCYPDKQLNWTAEEEAENEQYLEENAKNEMWTNYGKCTEGDHEHPDYTNL